MIIRLVGYKKSFFVISMNHLLRETGRYTLSTAKKELDSLLAGNVIEVESLMVKPKNLLLVQQSLVSLLKRVKRTKIIDLRPNPTYNQAVQYLNVSVTQLFSQRQN